MSSSLRALPAKVLTVLRNEGIKGLGFRGISEAHRHLRNLLNLMTPPPLCKLCHGTTKGRRAYGRSFHQCQQCNFIFAVDYDPILFNVGMGMEGSWTGPGSGGYREYYLVKMLMQELSFRSFLLFGTGNTPTFARLREEGVNVVGCDISQDVIKYKRAAFGNDSFFTPGSLPVDRIYDGIIAVEVFEHFAEPRSSFDLLMSLIRPNGVICGTTNFYPGGPIEDDNKPGYMSHKGHVAYWSLKSMTSIGRKYQRAVAAFEMIRPGSVLPDEKYGQLWPNKRVFFIYEPSIHQSYFEVLLKSTPVLPIDKP